jgi:hypothetical protein
MRWPASAPLQAQTAPVRWFWQSDGHRLLGLATLNMEVRSPLLYPAVRRHSVDRRDPPLQLFFGRRLRQCLGCVDKKQLFRCHLVRSLQCFVRVFIDHLLRELPFVIDHRLLLLEVIDNLN